MMLKEFILRIRLQLKLTYIVLAINILIWIAMELFGLLILSQPGGSTNSLILLMFGALSKNTVASGEVWRMITSAFLHIGLIHLAVNSYTLFQLGTVIERFFGQEKFIATYVFTALSASLISLAFSSPGSISAGASGALFGLTGLLLGNAWAKKHYTFDLPIDERQLIPFVIMNLYIGFVVPGINNWAHIGGLAGGIALGYVFDPAVSFDPSPIKRILTKILEKLSIIMLIISALFWFLSFFGIFSTSYTLFLI